MRHDSVTLGLSWSALILFGQLQTGFATSGPDLTIGMSHGSGFAQSQPGFYRLTVTNPGSASTSGAVSVTAQLPAGFAATAISGNGWNCTLASLSCTRSDALAAGLNYLPIAVIVTASAQTGTAIGTATVSGGGDSNPANNSASDMANVRLAPTVTLTSSPNPSTAGQSVALTATVSAGTGRVTFYEGTAILGSATLSGTLATLAIPTLTAGAHSLTARYGGDATHGVVASPVHAHNVNSVATLGVTKQPSFPSSSWPNVKATADFNLDGKLDLVAIGPTQSSTLNSVSVLPGNGDGTFQLNGFSYSEPEGTSITELAVADFNGDGKPDIVIGTVIGYGNVPGMLVFLGNGDGTFQNPTVASAAVPNATLFVADMDNDGVPDIVAFGINGVSVLIGNGDGTFQTPLTDATFSFGSLYATLTDINGDGNIDIVVANALTAAPITVMLGTGAGTFATPQSYPGYSGPRGPISAGDFNGDGRSDVLELYMTGAEVFAGNPDGTLQSGIQTTSLNNLNGLSVPATFVLTGDFNADGKLDFAYTGSSGAPFMTVALGQGDGTFPESLVLPTDGGYGPIVLGDFNGDGRPDFLIGTSLFLGSAQANVAINVNVQTPFSTGNSGAFGIQILSTGYAATSGTVTVTDTIPAGLTATTASGTGWTCTVASVVTCNRSDSLPLGGVYPLITINATVSSTFVSPYVTNQVSVSNNGVVSSVSQLTPVAFILPRPVLVSPTDQQTNVSLTPTLIWTASLTATSYDVLLGTTSILLSPLANTTGTSYNPAKLQPGTLYYWRITAYNSSTSASSIEGSFTTTSTSYEGSFEAASCSAISGWAADGNRLNQSISVSIYDGTTLLATIPANQYRSDVATSLGDNGLHGFTYTPPASIANGVPHTIHIYYETSSTELTNSGRTLTCGSASSGAGLAFYPITPCRIADTRVPAGFTGEFGPPTMIHGTTRMFDILSSPCASTIPSNVAAYAFNFTVVPPSGGPPSNLTTWPAGSSSIPNVSTLNYAGSVVANAAIVPAGNNGSINVYVNNTTDVLFDITGYFAPPTASGLEFYAVSPCRIADTRVPAGFSGQFGPPSIAGGSTRVYNILSSSCASGIPSTVSAYSLNFTVVPPSSGPPANLTTWPSGATSMPNVSTLNYSNTVVANAAIVPAGTNEAINVFANYPTDVLFDINGYFAPPQTAGLHFYPVAPCRIADTRVPAGFTGQFGPPAMTGGSTRNFNIPASGCGIPSSALAYSLNFTVVPPAGTPAANLTTCPAGGSIPNVSTLNYYGSVVANAAIVPAGSNGSISVFVNYTTDVLFDINGYFAP